MKQTRPIGIICHATDERFVIRACADAKEICGVTKSWMNQVTDRYESYDYVSKNGKVFTLVRLPEERFRGPMSEESKKFIGGGQGNNEKLNRPLNPVTWHKESICWSCAKSSDYRLCPWVLSKHRKKDVPKGCRTHTIVRSNHNDLKQPEESIIITSCKHFEEGRRFGEYDTEACNKVVFAMCKDTSKQLESIAQVASRFRRHGQYKDYQSQLSSLRFYGKFYEDSEFGESFISYLRSKYDINI